MIEFQTSQLQDAIEVPEGPFVLTISDSTQQPFPLRTEWIFYIAIAA